MFNTLSGSTGKVVASHAKISGSSPGLTERDLYVLCASGVQEVLPCEGRGVTASQLDLASLTPLSVAGCGRLQLVAAHWATWVTLLQVVDNLPHKFVVVDSPLGGPRPKKTLL